MRTRSTGVWVQGSGGEDGGGAHQRAAGRRDWGWFGRRDRDVDAGKGTLGDGAHRAGADGVDGAADDAAEDGDELGEVDHALRPGVREQTEPDGLVDRRGDGAAGDAVEQLVAGLLAELDADFLQDVDGRAAGEANERDGADFAAGGVVAASGGDVGDEAELDGGDAEEVGGEGDGEG